MSQSRESAFDQTEKSRSTIVDKVTTLAQAIAAGIEEERAARKKAETPLRRFTRLVLTGSIQNEVDSNPALGPQQNAKIILDALVPVLPTAQVDPSSDDGEFLVAFPDDKQTPGTELMIGASETGTTVTLALPPKPNAEIELYSIGRGGVVWDNRPNPDATGPLMNSAQCHDIAEHLQRFVV